MVGKCKCNLVAEAQKPSWHRGIAIRKVFARPESFCASGKFLRVQKVFARITEKYLVNCPNTVGHLDINLLFQVPLGVHLADILDLQLQCPDLSERAPKLCCVLMSTPDNQQPKPG